MFISGEELVKLGQEASFNYFSDSLPLNESILKIATVKDLNKEQIKRVCHSANQSTMLQMYDSDSNDNTDEFEVADANYVMDKLGMSTDIKLEKHAHYNSPPPVFLTSKIGIKTSSILEKIASKRPEYAIKNEAKKIEKLAHDLELRVKEALQDEFEANYKCASNEAALEMVISRQAQAGHSLDDMIGAIKKALAHSPEMLEKAIELVKRLFEKVKTNSPGILSRAWSGIKSLFKMGNLIPTEDAEMFLTKTAAELDELEIKKELFNKSNIDFTYENKELDSFVKSAFDSYRELEQVEKRRRSLEGKLSIIRKELE